MPAPASDKATVAPLGVHLGAGIETLLLGALLTLAAQAFLQLRIIPNVEARKRREDRGEKDVRELGELLTGDVAEAARAAETATHNLVFVRGLLDSPEFEQGRVEERLRVERLEATESMRRLSDLGLTRVSWLVRGIVRPAAGTGRLAALEFSASQHEFSLLRLSPWSWFDHEGDEARANDFNREREAREALHEAVEELAAGTAPRPPTRMWRTWREARRLAMSGRGWLSERLTKDGRARLRKMAAIERVARADPSNDSVRD